MRCNFSLKQKLQFIPKIGGFQFWLSIESLD